MATATRYVIRADFSTDAADVTLDAPGQTALLCIDPTHSLRVAVLPSGESATRQCLVAYDWDTTKVALEVNAVAYWRAPVPLVHGDCILLRALDSTEVCTADRRFRVEVRSEDAQSDTPHTAAQPSHPSCHTRSTSSARGSTAPSPSGPENLALWHNYYWYRYNVAPDGINLATREPLGTAPQSTSQASRPTAVATSASETCTVDEWAIKALLRRHGVLVAAPDKEATHGARKEDGATAPADDGPPCLFVSHIVVDETHAGCAQTGCGATCSPAGPAGSTSACCGVCPLQSHVRRRHGLTGAGEASATDTRHSASRHIVDQLRALATQDGLDVPPLPPTTTDTGDAVAAVSETAADETKQSATAAAAAAAAPAPCPTAPDPSASSRREDVAESPWSAYVDERARVAAEREQQAVARERKRLEKSGESCDHLLPGPPADGGDSAAVLAGIERALQRISELEYMLNGPQYVSYI